MHPFCMSFGRKGINTSFLHSCYSYTTEGHFCLHLRFYTRAAAASGSLSPKVNMHSIRILGLHQGSCRMLGHGEAHQTVAVNQLQQGQVHNRTTSATYPECLVIACNLQRQHPFRAPLEGHTDTVKIVAYGQAPRLHIRRHTFCLLHVYAAHMTLEVALRFSAKLVACIPHTRSRC